MSYYVIGEYFDNELITLRGPYTSINDAYNVIDKCKAERAKRPLPLKVSFRVHSVLRPDYYD